MNCGKRICAFFTLIFFLMNAEGRPGFGMPPAKAPDFLPPGTQVFPPDLGSIEIPPSLGKIEEFFQGKSRQTVVLIQDAHAVPDAQLNIWKLIGHFEKEYGIRKVAVEGAASGLDTQFFRSFPDPARLRKIFDDYLAKNELSGPSAAALFSSFAGGTSFFGIEDWDLYEQGLGYFLKALEKEPGLLARIKAEESELLAAKKKSYSKQLFEIDQSLEAFQENQGDLKAVLRNLAAVKNPEVGSELALITASFDATASHEERFESEIKRLAQKVEEGALSPEDRQTFNEKYQLFRTSGISAGEFAAYLKEGRNIKISDSLLRVIQNHKRLRDLEGTKFFKEFTAYADSVKEKLFRSEEARSLDRRGRQISLVKKLVRLELSREDWEKVKGLSFRGPAQDARAISDADIQEHNAFYENAEKRDTVFFEKLEKLKENSIVTAGGFHAHGLTRRFREAGISYVLVRPEIQDVPEDGIYRRQMLGEVSWKSYFRVKNGKVNLSDAFTRAVRDKLLNVGAPLVGALEGRGQAPPLQLKPWRDQILRDLAERGQMAHAARYTRFLDELTPLLRNEAGRPEWIKALVKILEDLRRLDKTGQFTEQNILQLFKPSTMPAAAIAGQFASRAEIRADLVMLPGQIARSESRSSKKTISFKSFNLLREVDKGAFGKVYAASLQGFEKPVALKIIEPADYFRLDYLREYVKHEIKALKRWAKEDNPYSPRFYGAGFNSKRKEFWIAMELVEGRSLEKWALRFKKTPEETVQKFEEALGALQEMHDRGLVHADLKRGHVLVTEDGGIKILDLGEAYLDGQPPPGDLSQAILGINDYTAPEFTVQNSRITPQADLFSMGVLLFKLATGTTQINETKLLKYVKKSQSGQIKLAEIEALLEPAWRPYAVVMQKALRLDPAQRLASANEMSKALKTIRELQESSGRRSEARSLVPSPEGNLKPGQIFQKRYEILKYVSKTDQSEIYEVKDKKRDRLVILKLRDQARFHELSAEEVKGKKLFRENKKNPLSPEYLDSGKDGKFAWLTLGKEEGSNLVDWIKGKKPSEILDLFERIVEAGGKVHERKHLHLDLKAKNIWVLPDGQVRLLDWEGAWVDGMEDLPFSGFTPAYSVPKDFPERKEPVPQTDIFSLGMLLYFFATDGRHLFIEEGGSQKLSVEEFFGKRKRMPRVREIEIQKEFRSAFKPFSGVIAKAMHADPSQRYQTAEEMLADFRQGRLESELYERVQKIWERISFTGFVEDRRNRVEIPPQFTSPSAGQKILGEFFSFSEPLRKIILLRDPFREKLKTLLAGPGSETERRQAIDLWFSLLEEVYFRGYGYLADQNGGIVLSPDKKTSLESQKGEIARQYRLPEKAMAGIRNVEAELRVNIFMAQIPEGQALLKLRGENLAAAYQRKILMNKSYLQSNLFATPLLAVWMLQSGTRFEEYEQVLDQATALQRSRIAALITYFENYIAAHRYDPAWTQKTEPKAKVRSEVRAKKGSETEDRYLEVLREWLKNGKGTVDVPAGQGVVFNFHFEMERTDDTILKGNRFRISAFYRGREIGFAHASFLPRHASLYTSIPKPGVPAEGLAAQHRAAIYVLPQITERFQGTGRAMMGLLMRLAREQNLKEFFVLDVKDEQFFRGLGFKFFGTTQAVNPKGKRVPAYNYKFSFVPEGPDFEDNLLPEIKIIKRKTLSRSEARSLAFNEDLVPAEVKNLAVSAFQMLEKKPQDKEKPFGILREVIKRSPRYAAEVLSLRLGSALSDSAEELLIPLGGLNFDAVEGPLLKALENDVRREPAARILASLYGKGRFHEEKISKLAAEILADPKKSPEKIQKVLAKIIAVNPRISLAALLRRKEDAPIRQAFPALVREGAFPQESLEELRPLVENLVDANPASLEFLFHWAVQYPELRPQVLGFLGSAKAGFKVWDVFSLFAINKLYFPKTAEFASQAIEAAAEHAAKITVRNLSAYFDNDQIGPAAEKTVERIIRKNPENRTIYLVDALQYPESREPAGRVLLKMADTTPWEVKRALVIALENVENRDAVYALFKQLFQTHGQLVAQALIGAVSSKNSERSRAAFNLILEMPGIGPELLVMSRARDRTPGLQSALLDFIEKLVSSAQFFEKAAPILLSGPYMYFLLREIFERNETQVLDFLKWAQAQPVWKAEAETMIQLLKPVSNYIGPGEPDAPPYWAVYKPFDMLSTPGDEHGNRKTVIQLFAEQTGLPPGAVVAAGRLDYDVEGLVVLTGDPEFLLTLMPLLHTDKTYHVWVEGKVKEDELRRFESGVDIPVKDGEGEKHIYQTKPAKSKLLRVGSHDSEIALVLEEGKYHQVKEMMKAIGHPVLSLRRVRFSGLELRGLGLRPGQIVRLEEAPLNALLRAKEKARQAFESLKRSEPGLALDYLFAIGRFDLPAAADFSIREFESFYPETERRNKNRIFNKMITVFAGNGPEREREYIPRLVEKLILKDVSGVADILTGYLTFGGQSARTRDLTARLLETPEAGPLLRAEFENKIRRSDAESSPWKPSLENFLADHPVRSESRAAAREVVEIVRAGERAPEARIKDAVKEILRLGLVSLEPEFEVAAAEVWAKEQVDAAVTGKNYFEAIREIKETTVIEYQISAGDLIKMENPKAVIKALLKVARDAVAFNDNIIVRVLVPPGMAKKRELEKIFNSLGHFENDPIRHELSSEGHELVLYHQKLKDPAVVQNPAAVTIANTSNRVAEGRKLISERYQEETAGSIQYAGPEGVDTASRLFTAGLVLASQLKERTVNGLIQYEEDNFRAQNPDALNQIASFLAGMLDSSRLSKLTAQSA